MVRSEDYIDRCVAAIGSIDPEQLSQFSLGQKIGEGGFTMYSLGVLSVLGAETHTGIKLPGKFKITRERAALEMAEISIMATRVPELLPRFPSFLGLVAIEGSEEPLGIITEDASEGHSRSVIDPAPFMQEPDEELDALYETLFSGFEDVYGVGAFHHDLKFMHFRVDGEIRFLDCFGVLSRGYRQHAREHYDEIIVKAWDAEASITITLSADSPLAKSVS